MPNTLPTGSGSVQSSGASLLCLFLIWPGRESPGAIGSAAAFGGAVLFVFAAPTSAWWMARDASTSMISDYTKLHVDQIVIGAGEERRSSHRARALGGWIGRRPLLIASRTKDNVLTGVFAGLEEAA